MLVFLTDECLRFIFTHRRRSCCSVPTCMFDQISPRRLWKLKPAPPSAAAVQPPQSHRAPPFSRQSTPPLRSAWRRQCRCALPPPPLLRCVPQSLRLRPSNIWLPCRLTSCILNVPRPPPPLPRCRSFHVYRIIFTPSEPPRLLILPRIPPRFLSILFDLTRISRAFRSYNTSPSQPPFAHPPCCCVRSAFSRQRGRGV
jgi:hypothetical protein